MLDLFLPLFLAQENPPLVILAENPTQTEPAVEDQSLTEEQSPQVTETTQEQLFPHDVPVPTEDQPSQVDIPRAIITQYQTVIPLPGNLNEIPVFNSNSPEVIAQEGILLSTFPKSGKAQAIAHLDTPLEGRFDIFTHHISRPAKEKRTLYQGLLVSNPTGQTRTLKVLRGLSYLNSTDAPFRELLPYVEDPHGYVYSGPGSRLVGDLLRGKSQRQFPEEMRIPPYSMAILANLPIPVSGSRSTYLQVETDGGIYLANLAQYEVQDERISVKEGKDGELEEYKSTFFRPPDLEEWRSLLSNGRLVEPRDRAPTSNRNGDTVIYGRVAGISRGTEWATTVGDGENDNLTIPEVGKAISFPISTTSTGTFATKQVQSAPMLARYPDTALQGHGNYLVYYKLTFPLENPTKEPQSVALTLQTPIKEDQYSDRLLFFASPPNQVFFRGTVRITYPDEFGDETERYVHLVQRRGEQGEPLAIVDIPAGETRTAEIDFFYPPDATPPQVITVTTLAAEEEE